MNKEYKYIHTEDLGRFRIMNSLEPHLNSIKKKLDTTKFNRNVFIMIKYRIDNKDLRDFIMKILEENGFNGVLADAEDWVLTKDDVVNPLAVLYCCKYGIAVFDEPEEQQMYNPNVAYELGIMHYQHKECLILIHDKIRRTKPFDLVSKLHKTYVRELQVEKHIESWINTIRIRENELEEFKKEKVAIAIVRNIKTKKFLLTKRKSVEDNLSWGFPAKRIHEGYDIKEAIISECEQETGIRPVPLYKMGNRIHPDTGKNAEYWYCECEEQKISNKDINELSEVKWLTGKVVIDCITSDIFEPVMSLLNE